MKLSAERTEDSQVVLNIEVEPEEMEKSLDDSYRRLVERVNIPGFRRGKAPRAMLERYVGRETLVNDALEHLVPQVCSEAIREQGIDVMAYPQVEIIQTDPVVLKATVPVQPSVELGDYRQLDLAPDPVEVSDRDVEVAIEQLRERHAVWEPVTRVVSTGDLVIIDVEGELEGETFLNEKGQLYLVQEDLPFPLPGFAQQLVGMEKGQTNEFHLSYPDDYQVTELAGKDYSVRVTVHEIKEKHLPDLNDEFARSLGEGLESLDTLQERIKANLKALADENSRRSFEDRIIKEIAARSRITFPPIMVEQEVNRFLAELARRFGGGDAGLEAYLKSSGKTEDEVREEFRPIAEERITRSLILGKVAEDARIEVLAEELDARIEEMAKDGKEKSEELKKLLNSPSGREMLEQMILTEKTVRYLVEEVVATKTEEEAGGSTVEKPSSGKK